MDEDAFLAAAHALWRKGRQRRGMRLRSVVLLVALPIGVWLAIAHDMWFVLLAIVALALLHFVFDWPLTRAFARRNFARLPAAGREIVWEIDERGLKTRIGDGEWERIAWKALADITATDAGFLLHLPPNGHYWLPMRAFASDDDLARFRALVARWQQGRT